MKGIQSVSWIRLDIFCMALLVCVVQQSCSKRAMAWVSRATTLSTLRMPSRVRLPPALPSSRPTKFVHEAFNRRFYYSLDDIGNRTIPPTFDSQLEEDGFGAYDYQPDPTELIGLFPDEEKDQNKRKVVKPRDRSSKGSSRSIKDSDVASNPSNTVRAKMNATKIESTNAATSQEDVILPVKEDENRLEGIVPPFYVHVGQNQDDPSWNDYLTKAAYGNGATSELDVLTLDLDNLEKIIYKEYKKEFNLNSPRQVSLVLFGEPGESTKKEVLEGMAAGGNRMASLVLQYREIQQKIKRLARKEESEKKGTRVKSVSTIVPAQGEAPRITDPVILVDASSFIFRAYYSMPPIHRTDGMPTGAVMGFCNMLNRLILNRMLDGEQPRAVLVFDTRRKTFRHDLYPAYKANRAEAPVDLIPQFALIRKAAIAYGIPQIEALNFEADDVIATLARMAQEEGIDVNILSGDKDLMQLVSDDGVMPVINMIDPLKMERITSQEVQEKWGVAPRLLGDVLALAGDVVDNVPGVPGIGPKTAAALLEEFGNLDDLLGNLDKVKQKGRRSVLQANVDKARLSRRLVELERHVPQETMTFPEGIKTVSDLKIEPINGDRILAFYDEMGFRDLKSRVQSRLDGVKRKRVASKYTKPKIEIPKPEEFNDVPF